MTSRRRHALGQHFLVSEEAIERIIESAALRKTDVVFEIGTGSGALTDKIAHHVLKVISYEKDHDLLVAARKRLSDLNNVVLIEGDAFAPFQAVIPFDVCITSLPYSRSLDFIKWLAPKSGTFRRATTVVQLDFARKLMALPTNQDYRAVSVIAQIAFRMQEITVLNRASFQPPPKVDSVIINFETNDSLNQPFLDKKRICEITKLFSFRGRLLRSAIRSSYHGKQFDFSDLPFKSERIEKLHPQQFVYILENIF